MVEVEEVLDFAVVRRGWKTVQARAAHVPAALRYQETTAFEDPGLRSSSPHPRCGETVALVAWLVELREPPVEGQVELYGEWKNHQGRHLCHLAQEQTAWLVQGQVWVVEVEQWVLEVQGQVELVAY